jgi:hypothetical protein
VFGDTISTAGNWARRKSQREPMAEQIEVKELRDGWSLFIFGTIDPRLGREMYLPTDWRPATSTR